MDNIRFPIKPIEPEQMEALSLLSDSASCGTALGGTDWADLLDASSRLVLTVELVLNSVAACSPYLFP